MASTKGRMPSRHLALVYLLQFARYHLHIQYSHARAAALRVRLPAEEQTRSPQRMPISLIGCNTKLDSKVICLAA
jgi:hypothetical protein